MLWNQVFEFFVKYIFGGVYNGISYYALLGGFTLNGQTIDNPSSVDVLVYEFKGLQGQSFQFSLGNYLSLIATIITMVAILLFCVFIIKKIIGIIFRLFTGSSAF